MCDHDLEDTPSKDNKDMARVDVEHSDEEMIIWTILL